MIEATQSVELEWFTDSAALQSNLFASRRLLFAWLGTAALVSILVLLGTLAIEPGVFLLIPISAFVATVFAYLLLNAGFQYTATWIALLTITAEIMIAVMIDPSAEADAGFLIYLTAGNLLAGMLLPWRQMLAYNALNVLAVLSSPIISPGNTFEDLRFTLFYIVILNVLIGIVVRVLMRYRDDQQHQLRINLEEQNRLLEAAFDGIVILDLDYRVRAISPPLLKQIGYQELKDVPSINNIASLLHNLNTTWAVLDELEWQAKSGDKAFFEGTYRQHGASIVLALRDITSRKREERDLSQRNDYLAALHHTAVVLLQTQDRNWILQQLLGYALAITGASHGGLIIVEDKHLVINAGKGIYESLVGQEIEFDEDIAGYVWRNRLPIALDNYQDWTGKHIRVADWPMRAVVGVPLVTQNAFYGIISLGHTDDTVFSERDVDALIQFADLAVLALHNATLYDDLMEYQQRLRAVVENTSDAIYIKDLEGRYLLFNPASERLFQANPEKVLGQRDKDLLPDYLYERVSPIDDEVVSTGRAITYEFEQESDGRVSTFLATRFPYLSESGEIEGVVAISHDVTLVKQAELELRRSETYYRSLINNALDITLIIDRDGYIRFYNDSLKRLLGYSDEALKRMRVLDMVVQSTRRDVYHAFYNLLASEQTKTIECSVYTKDGVVLIFELVAIDLTESPIIQGYIINARDITLRKQAEDKLARYAASMEALHNASISLSQSLTSDRVFETLAVSVGRIFPQMSLSVVHVTVPDDELPMPIRVYDRQSIQNRWVVQGLSQALAGMAFSIDKAILSVPDIQASAQFASHVSYSGSLLISPIYVDQELFGTLTIVSSQLNAFNENDEVLADMLIRQTTIILERVRLFRVEQERRQVSESLRDLSFAMNSAATMDELLETILFYVSQSVPSDAASIMILDAEKTYATIRKVIGEIPPSIRVIGQAQRFYLDEYWNLAHVFETKQPLVIADVSDAPNWIDVGDSWIRSYACAPILASDEIVGYLNLDSRIPNYFKGFDTSQLMVFANQIGVAIDKIRLIESEKAQRELSDTLREVSGVLTRSMSREQLLQAFLEQVARVVPYDAAAVWFLNNEGVALFGFGIGYHRFGVDDVIKNVTHNAESNSLMKQIMETKRVLIEPETIDANWPDPNFEWVKSWAGAPIMVQGEFFGMLTLDSTVAGFYNDEIHAPLLETLTRQLSIALENVILLEQVQDYAISQELRVLERTVELSRERQQLQTIVSSMEEGVIYFEKTNSSTDLTVRFANAASHRLFGFEYADVIDQPLTFILQAISDRSIVDKILELALHPQEGEGSVQQTWRGQFAIQHTEGFMRDCSAAITIVISEATQDVSWALMVIRDISKEKALMEQRERFVANASHELRNPLSNLVTRMYLLRNQPERRDEHISVMQRTVDRLTMLAEDLLDITRFNNEHNTLNPRQVDVRTLIDDVVQMQQGNAELKRVALQKVIPDQSLEVWADEKRIYQVITNLVVNAISYTKEQTTILLQVDELDDSIVLQVADQGAGIPPELHDQIFVPFFRASEGKVSGTGLGLAISKEIVDRHNGKIWVESEVGVGSRFFVKLPKRPPSLSEV